MRIRLIIFSIFIFSLPVATLADTESGLVGYWNFDQCDGSDASPYGNHGKLTNNVACVEGRIGKAAYMNSSSSSYMEVTHPTKEFTIGNNSFTMSAWVRTTSVSTTIQSIISRYACGFGCYGGATKDDISAQYMLNILSGQPELNIRDDKDAHYRLTTPDQVTDGQWHHIAGIMDRTMSQLRLFIDGQEKASMLATLASVTNIDSPLEIGRTYDRSSSTYSGRYYFNGDLDEVRVYNRVLAEGEVKELYTLGVQEHLGGILFRMTPQSIQCRNKSRGDDRVYLVDRLSSFDCEEAGLEVLTGDTIEITIRGVAQ